MPRAKSTLRGNAACGAEILRWCARTAARALFRGLTERCDEGDAIYIVCFHSRYMYIFFVFFLLYAELGAQERARHRSGALC